MPLHCPPPTKHRTRSLAGRSIHRQHGGGLTIGRPPGIVASVDVAEACKDVDFAVMVGGFPRKDGMERKDVMGMNVAIYKAQASALEQYASPDVKVRPESRGPAVG